MKIKGYRGLKSIFLVIIATVAIMPRCTNDYKKPEKVPDPSLLYFDYKIWGDEESGMITLTLQYRLGSEDGTPVALGGSSKVAVDGEVLEPDSSKMNGIYYETIRPVADFSGTHRIVVSDFGAKDYEEEFDFSLISLRTGLPEIVQRGDLEFELEGLDTLDYIHVVLTDTSFYGRGIDRIDTVRNGRIIIARNDLANIKTGPVFLEFYKEEDWPLKETTPAGGRMNISYGIKRAFELKGRRE